jgi:hypothetical protein
MSALEQHRGATPIRTAPMGRPAEFKTFSTGVMRTCQRPCHDQDGKDQ